MKALAMMTLVLMMGCMGQVEEPPLQQTPLANWPSIAKVYPEPTGMRCTVPSGVTVDCAHLPDGYNGIVDEITGDRCARAEWMPPYKGHCKTGSPCEVVHPTEDGIYEEGVCE